MKVARLIVGAASLLCWIPRENPRAESVIRKGDEPIGFFIYGESLKVIGPEVSSDWKLFLKLDTPTEEEVQTYLKEGISNIEKLIHDEVVSRFRKDYLPRKAVNSGLELNEKNQEIVFETLGAVKDQLTDSSKRFRALFTNN